MPLRTQTCSNDVLSVYSSAVTNSSEGPGGTEGLEMQDWRLQSSIIVTICTWKCFSYCHTEESLSHKQGAVMLAIYPPSWWPCSTSREGISPPATWEIHTLTYLSGPMLSTHIFTTEMWKSSKLTTFLPPLVPLPLGTGTHTSPTGHFLAPCFAARLKGRKVQKGALGPYSTLVIPITR